MFDKKAALYTKAAMQNILQTNANDEVNQRSID